MPDMPPTRNKSFDDDSFAGQLLSRLEDISIMLQGDPSNIEQNPGIIASIRQMRWQLDQLVREREAEKKERAAEAATMVASNLNQARMVRVAIIAAVLSVFGSIISGVSVAAIILNFK